MASATDNRTTELREKLTERGVKFATDDSAASKVTMWTTQNGGWMFDCDYMEPLNEKPGTIGAKTELMIYGYTPEQAIAATLGNSRAERTCYIEGSYYDELFDETCTNLSCGHAIWQNESPNYCSECGAKVVGE